jgi:phage shock protein PspC (stress-responsive transcriptional regulator)
MKKTVQIHIGGRHFQIDEDAYQKLNHYLDTLKSHFKTDGESGPEIIEDIEHRVAELLEAKVTNGKQSVTLDDVNETIGILGKVEDFTYGYEPSDNKEDYYYSRKDNRRLYRDPENCYLGGVASGLGEYFNIDPLWIRLAFVCLIFAKGVGLLIYVILWLVVPKARTTTEKLQMRGKPVNLSTIKDSVNAEYDKVKSNVQGFSNSPAADSTRNAFENLIRAFGMIIVAVFKFIIGAIGIFFIVLGSIFLAVLIMFLFGLSNVFGGMHVWNGLNLPDFANMFASSGYYYLAVIALIFLVVIPIAALIYGGIKIIFNIQSKHRVLRAFLLTAWILALILFVTLLIVNVPNSAVKATGSQSTVLSATADQQLRISSRDNTEDRHLTHYWVLGYRFNYSDWDESLYNKAELTLELSPDDEMHLTVLKSIKNVGMKNSQRYLDRIVYNWEFSDSAVVLDQYFSTDEDDFWMFSDVALKLKIPEGQVIVLSQNTCDMLEEDQREKYCGSNNSLIDRPCLMTPDGMLVKQEIQKTRSGINK